MLPMKNMPESRNFGQKQSSITLNEMSDIYQILKKTKFHVKKTPEVKILIYISWNIFF